MPSWRRFPSFAVADALGRYSTGLASSCEMMRSNCAGEAPRATFAMGSSGNALPITRFRVSFNRCGHSRRRGIRERQPFQVVHDTPRVPRANRPSCSLDSRAMQSALTRIALGPRIAQCSTKWQDDRTAPRGRRYELLDKVVADEQVQARTFDEPLAARAGVSQRRMYTSVRP